MDSNDIRNLQEAYNQVYQVDEAEKWIQKAIKKPGALSKQLGVPEDENIPAGKLAAAAKKGGKLGKRARLAMTLKGLRREEIDLYDAVFTHLLDEGYADTEEAAVKIMANMSEEWRESIISEAPGEWFGGLRDKARASRDAQMQASKPTPKPGPSVSSPFAKPASTNDSGRLTTYGAGGGSAAERRGQTRSQVMQQGAKNLETKNRPNPGPNFGR